MPEPSLSGVLAKLRRASEHIDEIEREIQAWLDRDPYSERLHHVEGDQIVAVLANIWDQPDLRRLAAIGGDCTYALRSSLDLLAWQLALRECDEPHGRTEFPIFKDPDLFRSEAERKMRSISDPGTRTVVEWVQPFRNTAESPQDDPLWVLHEMCNEDKHRSLRPFVVQPTEGTTRITSDPEGIPLRQIYRLRGPVEDNAPLIVVWFAEPPPQVKMESKMTLGIGVEVAGQFTSLPYTLKQLRKRVREIVAEFKDAF